MLNERDGGGTRAEESITGEKDRGVGGRGVCRREGGGAGAHSCLRCHDNMIYGQACAEMAFDTLPLHAFLCVFWHIKREEHKARSSLEAMKERCGPFNRTPCFLNLENSWYGQAVGLRVIFYTWQLKTSKRK